MTHPRHLREWYMDLDTVGQITHVWTSDVEFTWSAVVSQPGDGDWIVLVTTPDGEELASFGSSAEARAWAEARLPLT